MSGPRSRGLCCAGADAPGSHGSWPGRHVEGTRLARHRHVLAQYAAAGWSSTCRMSSVLTPFGEMENDARDS